MREQSDQGQPDDEAGQEDLLVQGYRTFVVAGLAFVAPALAKWGFQVDANTVADAVIVLVPAAMAVMRAFTRTPPGVKE